MAKNILIFSDGTGQAGGLTPDQRLSNVYKMYRAMRPGPDSPISPADQVAFYDPGLGSAGDVGTAWLKIVETIRKFASSATGAGLGRNVIDCYEAILKHYEPGDRIYLFGFSRGAYTARCVAGVLKLCGVPTRMPDGSPLPRWGSALRAVAAEAVHDVYEHGSGRKRAEFQPERAELGRRFRAKYGSEAGVGANAAPYFIGVFDTVAALGTTGFRRFAMIVALILGLAALPALAALALHLLIGLSFWSAFAWLGGAVAIVAGLKVARARIKAIDDYPQAGQGSWHWSGWRFKFYDTYLDRQVAFARHALAIDETRDDFKRVPWGQPSEDEPEPQPGVPERFQQIWFAGNHSDIGGSYPEDESRLSDIALEWMAEQALSLPHPVLVDRTKLRTYPSAAGMQHCEVEGLLDSYPRWIPAFLRRTWKASPRKEAAGAPYHPTVRERLELPTVGQCGRRAPYRPEALRRDPALGHYYGEGAAAATAAATPK